MYDDVRDNLIPVTARAVAGYVNGRYANWADIVHRFPNAHKLSIAVTPRADAMALDVEPGDATNLDAPAWVKRQRLRGVPKPVLYTSASNVPALLRVLAANGIMRGHVRIWSAHYTDRQHICGPSCGFGNWSADATQWTDRSHGRSLDESLVRDDFFAPAKPMPKPVPAPAPKPKPVPAPKPEPVPADPANAPIPHGKIRVRLTDKDRSETTETTDKAGFLHRAEEFADGKFVDLDARRSL